MDPNLMRGEINMKKAMATKTNKKSHYEKSFVTSKWIERETQFLGLNESDTLEMEFVRHIVTTISQSPMFWTFTNSSSFVQWIRWHVSQGMKYVLQLSHGCKSPTHLNRKLFNIHKGYKNYLTHGVYNAITMHVYMLSNATDIIQSNRGTT